MSLQTQQPQRPFPPRRGPFRNSVPAEGRPPWQSRRRKDPGWTKILLVVVLAFLVAFLGGDRRQKVAGSATPTTQALVVMGPFIQAPLSPDQVEKLHHLPAYTSYKKLARMYLSRMTLDQKLGQLFMVQYWGYSYSDDLEMMIHDQYAGGAIVYGAQMNTFDQVRNDIKHMQKKAWMPLLISTDEEGGFVERIMNIYGHRPGVLETYETGKVENAAKLGHSIAHDLQALGINTDLAPDVDVPVVTGPDQYLRTWGYTPQSVIEWGGTYLRAIQGDGEIGCLKHFPGLGAATTDAHTGLPVD